MKVREVMTTNPVSCTITDTAQNTAALLRSNGGSLLRASLAAQPDPSVAKARDVNSRPVLH